MDSAQAQRYIDAVEADGRRLLEVAATDLTASVAACPGWDVTRLVRHMGQVHGYIATVVENASTEAPTHRFGEPAGDDVVAWAGSSLDSVLAALRSTDPATPSWTWGPDATVGFFHRRMAAETLVHRLDAEDAVDAPSAIDSDAATDAVDEFIDVALAGAIGGGAAPEGSLHLHRTDGEGEWLLTIDSGSLVATREHAKGDAAVRGDGPDLLRFVWNRPAAQVEIFGEEAVATAWREAVG